MKKQKRLMSLVLSLIMVVSTITVLPFTASALEPSGQCGENVTYTFDEATGTLTISGTGAMYDYEYDDDSLFYDNQDINTIVIESGVTSIGDNAFPYCESVTSVSIAGTVTRIGEFSYDGCSALKEVVIPNGVKSIGRAAFECCESLESINIPQSVTSVGSNLLYDTPYYYNTDLRNGEALVVDGWMLNSPYVDGEYSIDSSVKAIADKAFYDRDNLTGLTIPNSVTIIGEYVFDSCKGLTSITIPDSVTSMGVGVFCDCKNLANITLSNSITSITAFAFCDCGSLTGITIPKGVTIIDRSAFYGCKKIETITIPNSVTSIEWDAFGNCEILTDVYFMGSQKQWDAISIDNWGDGNSSLINATIHYIFTPCNKHTPGEKTITKPATCTESGVATIICSVCGKSYTEGIPAAGHKTVVDNAVPATFKKAGKTAGKHCSVCGKVLTAQKTVSKLGTPKMSSVKAGKKAFTATWTKANGVDGYQVQYSLKKNFKGAKTKKLNKTKLTVKNLKAKKTYYVRVRAYKKINGKMQYSNWSSKNVKIK